MGENSEKDSLRRGFLSTQIDLSKFSDADFCKATEEEKKQQDVMSESTTFFKDGMRKLRKNPLAMGSIVVLFIILALIIVAPQFIPYSYEEIMSVEGKRDKSAKNISPFEYSDNEKAYIVKEWAAAHDVELPKRISKMEPEEIDAFIEENEISFWDMTEYRFPHIFGTDEQCRDYFVRVIYGTRVSLAVGFFASIIVLIIGMIYGSISGYFGGKVDLIMMRIVDIIYSLPDMLIIILLSVVLNETLDFESGTILAKLGTSMVSLFIVFGLLYWVGMARLIRGQILSIKENEYILAAQSIGASSGRIIRKHILPNCLSVIIISTALQIPSAIFTESYLSFIGLGVKAPMPSLGSLANAAREGLQSYPYKLVFPALMICLIVLSLNLLGDGLRDAFDPKLKR